MILPSKELIEKVLGLKNPKCIDRIDDEFWIEFDIEDEKMFNIYEFAFKIKEWAYEHWFFIDSYTNINSGAKVTKQFEKSMYFVEKTEVEAIIKAGEWVLKQL